MIHCLNTEKHTESPFSLTLKGTISVLLPWNLNFCPPSTHIEYEGQSHILKSIELLQQLFLYV